MTNLDCSKLKGFADDNFKFDENGRRLYKQKKKLCGKRRNCWLRAISTFSIVFSNNFCRYVKTRACLGKGWAMGKSLLKRLKEKGKTLKTAVFFLFLHCFLEMLSSYILSIMTHEYNISSTAASNFDKYIILLFG